MIKNLLWKFFGKKYALGGLVQIYKFFNGYKTQICSVLSVVVYGAKILGFIEPDLANQLLLLLTGAGGVTLMHKFQKIDEDYGMQEKTAELRAEALKILEADKVVNPPLPPELK